MWWPRTRLWSPATVLRRDNQPVRGEGEQGRERVCLSRARRGSRWVWSLCILPGWESHRHQPFLSLNTQAFLPPNTRYQLAQKQPAETF